MSSQEAATNHLRAVRSETDFPLRYARVLLVVIVVTYGIAPALATYEFTKAHEGQLSSGQSQSELTLDTAILLTLFGSAISGAILISRRLSYKRSRRDNRILESTRYNALSPDGYIELAVKNSEFLRNLVVEAHRMARSNNSQNISRFSVQIAYRRLVSGSGWQWARLVGILGAFGLGATILQGIGYISDGVIPAPVLARLVTLAALSTFLVVLDFKQEI